MTQSSDAPESTLSAPRRAPFKSRAQKAKLPADAAKRQGDIATLAFLTLGSRDSAVAYLNAENSDMGGRPLAVATETDEGWQKVAGDIRRLAEVQQS